MSKRANAFEVHDFYCVNCGSKGIPLARQQSNNKGALHRKRMYCWRCQHTVNHVECRTPQEKEDFLIDFAAGKYREEAQDELKYEAAHPRFQNYLREMK